MPDSPPSSSSPASSPAAASERRPFVLVTGLSGAGRMTALNALEDMGYVAVDNMPLPLLGELMRSTAGDPGTIAPPLAFGVDTRTFGFDPQDLVRRARELRERPELDAKLLFLDCDTETLQRRYTESRRPHPLAPDRPVIDSIVEERRQIGWMRDTADLVIDTSSLSPHALKQVLAGHFALGPRIGTRLSVMSFSFRRGLPREADLVFDTRFLKNPHYEPALKPLTGRDPAVASFIATDPDYAAFLEHLRGLVGPLLPRFDAEGKSYLTIAVGCTGGRHRSVAVAEALADWLRGVGRSVTLTHRDADGAGGPGGAA
ncbi:MAG: RNase adapter RapZ [Rhodospirillales bacterium]|nr:RNase adapter RapZ [Rhodospirillales bacterium]